MTIDVATLVFEFKSDSAGQAEKAMDRLIEKGDRLDATAKRVRLASDRVNEGHRGAAGAAERAAQGAMALANAEGAAERAMRGTAAASAATRAARQLEAAAMRELVLATKAYERDQAAAAKAAAAAAREQAAAIASLEARIFALKSSIDPTFAAQSRLDAEMKEATALYKMGAISASDYAKAVGILDQRMAAAARGQGVVAGAYGRSADASRKLTIAGIDLSRQFADIGVTAAMGMNPLMILIQQGPQIADRLALMRMEGMKLSTVLGSMATAIAPFLLAAAPLIVAVGAVAAGFGLLHRELSKGYPKDITDGMNLTEEQLERVKTKTVSFGDTVQATFIVIGRHIMDGPIGDALKWLGGAFSATMDFIVKTAVGSMANVVGVFVGGYDAVKATWALLPRAMSDIGIQAANAMISAVEWMVNKSIAGLNKLIALANAGAAKVGLDARIDTLATQDFGRIQNFDAGAAAKAGETFGKAASEGFTKGAAGFRKGLSALGAEISAEALKLARKDALKEAGKANKAGADPKGAATPRDQTDERTAQIAGMLAQAMQDELQARLAITREARDRADLERQISRAALVEKQAQVDRQIANIADDKGLSDAKKKELTDQLLIVQAMNGRTAAIRDTAITEAMNAQLTREAYDLRRSGIENEIDLLSAQADITQSAYARSRIEVEILRAQQQIERLKLEEVIASATSTATEKAIAQARLNTLGSIHALELELAKRQTRLVNAIGEATDSVRGFKDAFKRHDWARVFDELERTIATIKASFAANGLTGGLLTAGSAAATLIGGKTGRAIGGGLGIAGMGAGLGGLLTANSLGAVGALTPLLGVGGAGAVGGGMAMLGSVLGPIGLAAGALYAAAKLFNVGGKPTNAGAGYDLTTGAISGNKRTSETEQAATAAGQAIQGIQDSLKAAGIGLTDSVRGLVIGTRDQTQIYLASGRELRSAVGDSGAAVDTAMRALLEGATYVSDAQKKLVDSALAAGKGFDAIAEILAQYEAAQKISGNLADEILRLTKPQAYDEQAVRREIEEARKSYQNLAADGYLTADQLATINTQLSTLEGLRLDEVMKRYANSVDAANDNLATLRGATESAEGMLRDAYDAYASAKQAEIAGLRQAAESLRAFRKELDFGAIAGRDPLSQYAATKREFDRLNALSASDPERLANLQSVSQAFLEASKIASPTELAFNRDLQAVRRATEASEMSATAQADYAQMQLDAQTAAVSQLIALNTTAISIEQAMFAVLAARANEVAGGGAANDNLDVGRYLALNPDLAANWNAGGSLRGAGMTLEDAARAHYATTGKWEVSQGLRTYANGGMHPGGLRLVGEEGPELEVTGPSRIYSARETAQMMGGDNSELLAEVRALRETVASQADQLRRIAVATDQTQSKLKDFEGNGMFVRGRTPDDAVETVAA